MIIFVLWLLYTWIYYLPQVLATPQNENVHKNPVAKATLEFSALSVGFIKHIPVLYTLLKGDTI